jgi:hypothetical protein
MSEAFLEALPLDDTDRSSISISSEIIYVAVSSYLQDIAALKFQREHFSDSRKRAAYLCYWLQKLRPIQIGGPVTSEAALMINEMFAVHVFLVLLEIEPDRLPSELYSDLIYQLHFRDVDASTLDLVGGILVRLIPGSA